MKPDDRDRLWQQLRDAGLAQGEIPPAQAAAEPWYVRVMLGVAGWIGAAFLLGFVGAVFAFVIDSATASMAIGLAACAAAYAILRAGGRNDFLMQFGFAVSLAGQVLFALGLFRGGWSQQGPDAWRLVFFALLEAGLVFAIAHFAHRVLSTWAAVYALGLALGQWSLAAAVPALAAAAAAIVWLKEFEWARHHSLVRPVGYGLALGLLQSQALVAWSLGSAAIGELAGGAAPRQAWIAAGLVGVVLVLAAWRLLAREAEQPSRRLMLAVYAAALLVALLGVRMPGLAAAAMLTVFGFANGNRVLLGIGIVGLLAFVTGYYYRLDATLLAKSGYLAIAGAALLAARQAFVRLFRPGQVSRA